jgi:endonuclease VIII
MEGPSLIIIREDLAPFIGKKITEFETTSTIDLDKLKGSKLVRVLTFGKLLLLDFRRVTIRIHFLMFGSYRINERKDRQPRLQLHFGSSEVNFYSCAVSALEESPEDLYDWSIDVMSEEWNPKKVRRKLKARGDLNVGDALLDQEIFAGVGNIIKNEVLYRTRIHPYSIIGALPPRKLTSLINEARVYSQEFYELRKIYQLSKHWQIYKKKVCKRCDLPVLLEHTGANPRRTFYCANCQLAYT